LYMASVNIIQTVLGVEGLTDLLPGRRPERILARFVQVAVSAMVICSIF